MIENFNGLFNLILFILVVGLQGFYSFRLVFSPSGIVKEFNTGEDSHGTGQDYGIGVNHLSLISSSTMPSTFYLGFYWYEGGSGHINFNRQENDNGGNAVSGMMVFELEDVS